MSQAAESDIVVLSSSDGEEDHREIILPARRSSRSSAVSSRTEATAVAKEMPKKQLKPEEELDAVAKVAGNGRNTKKRKRDEGVEEEKKTISPPVSCAGDFVATSAGAGLSSAAWAFPMTRMRRLIACGDGSNGSSLRTTLDSAFIIDQAAKLFLERITEEAYEEAMRERKKSLYYKHLSSTVSHEKRYEFLSDFVPEKMLAQVALTALADEELSSA